MIINRLILYPVKGMVGLESNTLLAQDRGFYRDRELMLVDENGKFISQRTVPGLLKFQLSLTADLQKLKITHILSGQSITYDYNQSQNSKIEVHLWKSSFSTSITASYFDDFFSDHLGMKLRLVRMDSNDFRKKKLNNGQLQEVSFADGYPYLFLSTSSIQQVAERVDKPINYKRFRPNVLLDSTEAFAEDNLNEFQLGKARFRMIKPCVRCQVVNIDPQTGHSSPEVLAALSLFRRQGNGVIMGMNAICVLPGEISKGERVRH